MSATDTYKNIMSSITAGEPVVREEFDRAVIYAKSSKRRTPKTENFIVVVKAPVKKVAAKKVAAKKVVTAKAPVTVKASKVCVEDDCDVAAYAKGRCSKHYTSHRRQDADQRELANKASRDYRARMAGAITTV